MSKIHHSCGANHDGCKTPKLGSQTHKAISGLWPPTLDHYGLEYLPSYTNQQVVGLAPQATKMVWIALNVVSKEWQVFVQSILGRETLPRLDRMWVDFQPRELRWDLVNNTLSGSNHNGTKAKVKEEENATLTSKGKQEQHIRKKDVSNIKCFRCGKIGHYVT